ncbi:unnamed protein product [Spirodela intermedia]|uniref:Protein FAR1-RELATED SEQUENCE n=1 Tax=Spirodela intermedia TaxID=51605 RepID=A0A7I8L1M3_SPIIN|nr:unnamed protein product [Spirodela intermedia]
MEGAKSDGDDLMDDDYVERILMEANARPGEEVSDDGDHSFPPVAPPLEAAKSAAAEPPGTGGGGVAEPFLGMEFESDEAAKNLYNEYARRLGFPFRVGRSRRSKGVQEVLIMKRFVCSKEGVYRKKASGEGVRKRERISMREGCKAFMEVIRDKDRWVVSKLETAHTHVLGTCSRAGYLRARGFIDAAERATIVASDATTLLRQTAFGEGGDAQGLLDYFRRRQAENPGFFYALQVDNRSCVTNAFWADARARTAYACFGDAVTFDTTYKKNKYMLPFVAFSGVNHHLQPVIFGCALLIDETEFSFAWLFETWLEAMGGRQPASLTSDQNRAMAAAVARVFPGTRHRFCKWLILSRTKQKLAGAYASHPTLREELESCVIHSETVRSFESSWVAIVDRYDLRKNTWLQALFNIRQRWVPLYLRDAFFAEVSPAQKLETVNDVYKRYFNTKTSLKVFLTQFELAMAARHEKEAAADCETLLRRPALKTASPIEKQAAEVYTGELFERFQDEFVECLAYNAYKIKDGAVSKYSVARDEDSLDNFVVSLDAGKRAATCSCGKFEFAGILCRHVLGVLLMVDLRVLPDDCFLPRWTRNAKARTSSLGSGAGATATATAAAAQGTMASRYNDLCQDAIRLAEKGASSAEVYKVAKAAMDKAFSEILAAESILTRGAAQRDAININEEITIDDASAAAAAVAATEPSLQQDPQRKVRHSQRRAPPLHGPGFPSPLCLGLLAGSDEFLLPSSGD